MSKHKKIHEAFLKANPNSKVNEILTHRRGWHEVHTANDGTYTTRYGDKFTKIAVKETYSHAHIVKGFTKKATVDANNFNSWVERIRSGKDDSYIKNMLGVGGFGALAGAVIGGLSGGLKSSGAGAGVGALMGAGLGAVGTYRSKADAELVEKFDALPPSDKKELMSAALFSAKNKARASMPRDTTNIRLKDLKSYLGEMEDEALYNETLDALRARLR